MDPVIKLEIGKYYRNREGAIVKINGQSCGLYGDTYPYDYWSENGRVSNLVTCSLDLIEEIDILHDANETNRFVFYSDEKIIRTIVYQDMNGDYHIDQETKIDHLVITGKDIHGAMDQTAYINWLSNALYNISYTKAKETDKKWMMTDD